MPLCILHLCIIDLSQEYFFRGARRHPIWKSEAEYRTLFNSRLGKENLGKLEADFIGIERFIVNNLGSSVINDEAIKYCQKEHGKIECMSSKISEADKKDLKSGLESTLKWFQSLRQFSEENNVSFDFVIISVKNFQSGFLKDDINNILIDFPNCNSKKQIKDVTNVLSSEKSREHFFYLFYRRNGEKLDVSKFVNHICMELMK